MRPLTTGRRLSAVATALLLVASSTLLAGTAGAQTTSGAPADCSDRVEVLLMIDESASLRTTDPQNRRVEAGEVLVRSLSASAEASGGQVNLTIAGFGSSVERAGTAVLPAETDAAVGVVASFADRTDGRNTDYVLALQFAVDTFRELSDVPTECKRLVWFTDGAYSIDDAQAPGIATYTSSTEGPVIEGEFEAQVCGALPGPSRLVGPLSEQIRTAGFVVQLVDFRSSGPQTPAEAADRAATDPVIDRLLAGDGSDPCRVPGSRVEAGQAGALATEFFNQGQIALGRRELPCVELTGGLPSGLVRAVTARAGNPSATVTIVRDGSTVASGTGYSTFVAPDDTDAVGVVTAQVSSGDLDGCFADLAATIAPVGEATIFGAASTSVVRFAVRGGAGRPTSLGPEAVDVAATRDGQPLPTEWQEASRTWQVTVPGPVDVPPVLEVTASLAGWGTLATITQEVDLLGAPPLPAVAWDGPTTLEGSGTFVGRLTILPGAATGGTLCVTFAAPVVEGDLEFVTSAEPRCATDDAPFDVPGELVVGEARNDDASVSLGYTATYAPSGSAQAQPLDGTGQVEFPPLTLTKPADAATSALLTAVLVLVSGLVPIALLLLLVNLQRRLPNPAGRRVASVGLVADGGALHLPAGAELTEADLLPLQGSRRRYDIAPGLTATGRPTWNPFAEVTVEVESEIGPVTAVPWMAAGRGRAVEVPAAFEYLVLLHAEPGAPGGDAVVVTPPGGTPEQALEAVADALRASNLLWARVSSALGSVV
jgi:hypothetical protein